MMGQDNKLLFWVPVEHRKNLCLLPQSKITQGWLTKLNLSNFRYSNKWTECIDKEWLKELKDKEIKMARLLGWERKMQDSLKNKTELTFKSCICYKMCFIICTIMFAM